MIIAPIIKLRFLIEFADACSKLLGNANANNFLHLSQSILL